MTMLAEKHRDMHGALSEELGWHMSPQVVRTRVDIEVARRDAVDVLQRLRGSGKERLYFDDPTVARLLDHQRGDALSTILSMYALSDVFHCATRFTMSKPREDQWEVRAIFTHALRQQLDDTAPSHFLTMEMFEKIRDNYPRFAGSVMADLAVAVGFKGRQSLFVCLAEGYEKSFGGAKQLKVPHFTGLGECPRFRPGKVHRLDTFAEEVCSSAMGRSMDREMEWANHRLARWAIPPNRRGSGESSDPPETARATEFEVAADCAAVTLRRRHRWGI
jgi:hypothetical protein